MASKDTHPQVLPAILVVVGLLVQSGLVWVAASYYFREPSQLAVFDTELSVEKFVRWSEDRVADDQFDTVLAQFGADVETKLSTWSQTTGVAVVRTGSVLSSGGAQVVDWTDFIVGEVLQ